MNEAMMRRRRQTLPPAERRQRILQAATDLFLDRGFDAVSVEAITQAAGGSKRDPYILFGDKLGLFREVVANLCETSVEAIGDIDASADLRSALVSLGDRILASLLSARTLALHRLVVAEAARLPGIGQLFLQQGPLRAYDVAAALFERHDPARSGSGDLRRRASVLVDALLGDLQLRALLGEPITTEDIHRKVRVTVDLLLPALVGPPDGRRLDGV